MSRPRRHHKKPYITVHPDGTKALREQQVRREARWTLLELIERADIETHTLRGSLRWLAGDMGMDRGALRAHLEELEEFGWLRIRIGVNQREGFGTVIELPRWETFTGEVAGEVAGEAAGVVDGTTSQQTPSDQQERASSTSSTSSTSSKGPKSLGGHSTKKKPRTPEPWGDWTPQEPWSEVHLGFLRYWLAKEDEGYLFDGADLLSAELYRVYTEKNIPPTEATVKAAIRDVLGAAARAADDAYYQEKKARSAEINSFEFGEDVPMEGGNLS